MGGNTVLANGLQNLSDDAFRNLIETDQRLSKEKYEEAVRYQSQKDYISAQKAGKELDIINRRLNEYTIEARRRNFEIHRQNIADLTAVEQVTETVTEGERTSEYTNERDTSGPITQNHTNTGKQFITDYGDGWSGRRHTFNGRDLSGSKIQGISTPGAGGGGACDGGTVFCGIGLEEGANQAGNDLDAQDAGITTNIDLKKLIIGWTKFILAIVAIVAVVAIIYAGILMVTQFGNEGQVDKAKKIIIWCVIGLIVIFVAYAIVNSLTVLSDPGSGIRGSLTLNKYFS